MTAMPYSPLNYPEVCAWWKARGWPCVPADALPAHGFIVPGHAAIFLYRTDSSLGWLEWAVSNPDTPKEARSQALDAVIASALAKAKQLRIKTVFSSVAHKGLLERLQTHEFAVSDEGMTNVVRNF